MNYETMGANHSASTLQEIAQHAYHEVLLSAVCQGILEAGSIFFLSHDENIRVLVAQAPNKEQSAVQVVDRTPWTVEVFIPHKQHWQSAMPCVETPAWLRYLADEDLLEHISTIGDIEYGEVDLKWLAEISGRDLEEVRQELIEVGKHPRTTADRILALSVRNDPRYSSRVRVDLRGYLLARFAAEVFPPATGPEKVLKRMREKSRPGPRQLTATSGSKDQGAK